MSDKIDHALCGQVEREKGEMVNSSEQLSNIKNASLYTKKGMNRVSAYSSMSQSCETKFDLCGYSRKEEFRLRMPPRYETWLGIVANIKPLTLNVMMYRLNTYEQ